jgi:hypothetical protein
MFSRGGPKPEVPFGPPGSHRLSQAAEKLVGPVILRSRRRRRISHCVENTQSEILRFAQNDNTEAFFRSLFQPSAFSYDTGVLLLVADG